MSWIKDNKFLGALGGGTLVGAALLFFVGAQGSSRYDAAKARFDAAVEEATACEKGELYPKATNRDGKDKALKEYRQSVESLQAAFEPYRPKEIKDLTPQEFTTRLLAANSEVRKAFEDAETTVPEAFFVGFESYKTSLAPGKATGILDYQLGSIKSLMLALAKAKPTALKNLYRPTLPEEESKTFTPSDSSAARAFPLEVTFVGPEKSAREFLSSLAKVDNQYVVVRSLRITNEKKDPPRAADAQFDKPADGKPAAGSAAAIGGAFVLPGDEAAPAKPAAEAAAAPKSVDSSRLLSQVLGNEQVQVFLRLDILEFLPAKKLP